MQLTNEFKRNVLKATTAIVKKKNGKGPQNIYIKVHSDAFHIVIQGFKSDYENYLISSFGDEAIQILKGLYDRDAKFMHQDFLDHLEGNHDFVLSHVVLDFENDVCQAIIKL
ncbi:MAG TPA: hypothetical protein DCS67_00125 [Clostridiales bacterium UBA8960]|jgi:hypothetical protein|nr:hypothetical protein [Clostridiales bacterium UBA8960]